MVLLTVGGAGRLTLPLIGAVIGIYIGIRGLVSVISALLNRRTQDPSMRLAQGGVAVVIGVLSVTVPESVVSAAIVTAALIAVVTGVIMIAWSLRGPAHRPDGEDALDEATSSIPAVVWDWILGSDIGRTERAAQAATLYFEAPSRRTKLGTWWVMLVLSVAIASFAVLADSTAVVIGAMLVAPLMTPILGLAGALVNGWGRRALHSAALVAAGALAAVTLAYGVAAWSPVVLTVATNSQIVSRVSPNTIDMLIALAAGAAGAFATVNARVASGIAGVAIAVALVPPLAVVGICLNVGEFGDAGGAALLFLTNFVAIVLSAGVTFVLTGFARPYALAHRPAQIAKTVAPFVVGAGIILVPLMATSEGLLQSETHARNASATVNDWLGEDSAFTLTDLVVADGTVQVTVTGPGEPPSANALLEDLQDVFADPVGLELSVVPVEVTELEAP